MMHGQKNIKSLRKFVTVTVFFSAGNGEARS